MSWEKSGLFIWAFLAGVVVTAQILANYGTIAEVDAKIVECQKDLPRSQTCVLIAIPKQESQSNL